MPYISLKNVSFKYTLSDRKTLSNINLDIFEGDRILLIGKKGSSKSTLLQTLKKSIQPVGTLENDITLTINDFDIAYVPQNVSATFLSKKVIQNIVFTAENLGLPPQTIEKRLSEVCLYLSITHLLDKDVDNLSGGEKQLVAIASAIITYPKVLLLDEPLSELSVSYRKKIMDILKLLNEETNMAIIICEHQINDCIDFAEKICLLENGNLVSFNKKEEVFKTIFKDETNKHFITDITKLSLFLSDKVLYTPMEFKNNFNTPKNKTIEIEKKHYENEIMSLKNITYFYDKNKTIFEDLNLSVKEGQKIAILGDNGSGKTTLLKLIAKIHKPYDGVIKSNIKKVSYLPQNIFTYFTKETVLDELKRFSTTPQNENIVKNFNIEHLFNNSPYELSSGEALIVCLCCVILSKSDILLFDEPTKNLDVFSKKIFGDFIKNSDITIIMSTHDLDFCAEYVLECSYIFNKKACSPITSKEFMLENTLFTTSIKKATKYFTTYDEAINLWD